MTRPGADTRKLYILAAQWDFGICSEELLVLFSAPSERQKMKNIVPASKNPASDGWVWARKIRKETKHRLKGLRPTRLQQLWKSRLGSRTEAVISEFSARALGVALIDKLQVTLGQPFWTSK